MYPRISWGINQGGRTRWHAPRSTTKIYYAKPSYTTNSYLYITQGWLYIIAYSHHRHKQEICGHTKLLLLQINFSTTALFFIMKPTSIWSTHKVELQYQLSPIDLQCWIFVLEPMGSHEISLQICYYFGLARGRVLPPWVGNGYRGIPNTKYEYENTSKDIKHQIWIHQRTSKKNPNPQTNILRPTI